MVHVPCHLSSKRGTVVPRAMDTRTHALPHQTCDGIAHVCREMAEAHPFSALGQAERGLELKRHKARVEMSRELNRRPALTHHPLNHDLQPIPINHARSTHCYFIVGIVSKETGAASVGKWDTKNWDNQTNWLSKLYHRKVKTGVLTFRALAIRRSEARRRAWPFDSQSEIFVDTKLSNFWFYRQNPKVWPFIEKLLSSNLLWYCLLTLWLPEWHLGWCKVS